MPGGTVSFPHPVAKIAPVGTRNARLGPKTSGPVQRLVSDQIRIVPVVRND
jgi:hypothetical protein